MRPVFAWGFFNFHSGDASDMISDAIRQDFCWLPAEERKIEISNHHGQWHTWVRWRPSIRIDATSPNKTTRASRSLYEMICSHVGHPVPPYPVPIAPDLVPWYELYKNSICILLYIQRNTPSNPTNSSSKLASNLYDILRILDGSKTCRSMNLASYWHPQAHYQKCIKMHVLQIFRRNKKCSQFRTTFQHSKNISHAFARPQFDIGVTEGYKWRNPVPYKAVLGVWGFPKYRPYILLT